MPSPMEPKRPERSISPSGCYRAKENLIISIEDNGDSVFDPVLVATGKGTGLKNVEGRLFAMYHRRIGFENKKGGGLVVTMAVPIDSL